MRKQNNYFKYICWVFVCAFVFMGCSGNDSMEDNVSIEEAKGGMEEKNEEAETELSGISQEEDTQNFTESKEKEPKIVDKDWSEYFDELNGAAVVYDVPNKQYAMYNREQVLTRSSPCSTFKIISSLIALENGIIRPKDSTRTWSGEIFWNEDWNKDIDFSEAFHTSCVWYFRQVIDDIGKTMMQKELDNLQYGNCDISDWKGKLNTNNNNRALTGFWIESSLMISPKERVEVMERIFGEDSVYSEKTQKELKQVMLVSKKEKTNINIYNIYGKTGMGKQMALLLMHGLQDLQKVQREICIFACILEEQTI